jgi:LPS sulfotransferase NodH
MSGSGRTPSGPTGGYFEDLLVRLSRLGEGPSGRAVIAHHFPRPRFVWIRREDAIAQAVSWAAAIQTGCWHHWDKPEPHATPAYDREQIDALGAALSETFRGWARFS